MERSREELYKHINFYGLNDLRTIEKSKELDKLIVKEMEEKANGKS